MKGLLIKDLKILKLQKNTLFLFLFIAFFLAAFSDNVSFVIGYFTFVFSLFSLSSISYDELDNGNAFLFSLPITRKNYVIEKYYFGLILGMTSCIFSTILAMIAGSFKGTVSFMDTLMIALMIIPFMLITLSLMFPFQFKFGGDKARIAILCVFGLMFIAGIVIVKITEIFHIDIFSVLNNLPTLSMGMLIIVALIVATVILFISIKISISIVKKKEF